MKKILLILMLSFLLLNFAYADDGTVEIKKATFKIPDKYLGGEKTKDSYRLDNVFSIRCIDNNTSKSIGLWASEKDSSEDLTIKNHPVRHYCQYNKYVEENHSHAYFASGKSIYEISWLGEEIDNDIEKLIKNTPPSKIDSADFYNLLDESLKSYKLEKIDELNRNGEYNYLKAKSQSQYNQQETHDDAQLKEILLTYY